MSTTKAQVQSVEAVVPCPSRRRCSVPQCWSRKRPGVSLHLFPRDDRRKVLWQRLLNINKPISQTMCVCSKHFSRFDYILPAVTDKRKRLKLTAVPSRNLPVPQNDFMASETNDFMALENLSERLSVPAIAAPTSAPTMEKSLSMKESDDPTEIYHVPHPSTEQQTQKRGKTPPVPMERRKKRSPLLIDTDDMEALLQRREKNRLRVKRWRDAKKLKAAKESMADVLPEAAGYKASTVGNVQQSIKVEREPELSHQPLEIGYATDTYVKSEDILPDVEFEGNVSADEGATDGSISLDPGYDAVATKASRYETSFLYHMLFGPKDYRYVCAYCGKNFKKRRTAIGHLKMHVGDTPFVCKKCGKAWSVRNNLRRHMKTHKK